MPANAALERPVRTLRSLREEMFSVYTSTPNFLLHHAMMIVAGEVLSEQETRSSWTEYGVVGRGMPIRSIKKLFGCYIDQCYYGYFEEGAVARFESQSERLYFAALEALGTRGREYERPPYGIGNWIYLCYCMAWDYPDRVNYKIRDDSQFNSVCYGSRGPFIDRSTFTSWPGSSGAAVEGRFFGWFNADLLSCSIGALDAILGLVAGCKEVVRPRRRLDPAQDARNKWIYEQAESGVPHKSIMAQLKRKGESLTLQRIGQIVKEYAIRNNLPLVVASRGPIPPARL